MKNDWIPNVVQETEHYVTIDNCPKNGDIFFIEQLWSMGFRFVMKTPGAILCEKLRK